MNSKKIICLILMLGFFTVICGFRRRKKGPAKRNSEEVELREVNRSALLEAEERYQESERLRKKKDLVKRVNELLRCNYLGEADRLRLLRISKKTSGGLRDEKKTENKSW